MKIQPPLQGLSASGLISKNGKRDYGDAAMLAADAGDVAQSAEEAADGFCAEEAAEGF